jgi:MFS family permease
MRWLIAIWLTLSTILNVIEKQTLSIVAPFLRETLHISVAQYSYVVTAFLLSYGVMYAVGGWFVDRVGERIGMAACVGWWAVCTMLTSLVQGVFSLGAVRFLVGLGEPGVYPAALKTTTRWFPKAERGTPIALFSSGGAVGNMLAAPLIAVVALRFGWRAAFLLPGILGLFWLAGPGANNFDATAEKAMKTRDGLKLELRLDAFNVFNHTQFSGINSTINFTSITNATPTNLAGSGNLTGFGGVSGARNPRILQIVTCLVF